jgi:hypothetical protein
MPCVRCGREESCHGAVDAGAASVGAGIVGGCQVDPAGDDGGRSGGVACLCGGQEAGKGGAGLAVAVCVAPVGALRGTEREREGNQQDARSTCGCAAAHGGSRVVCFADGGRESGGLRPRRNAIRCFSLAGVRVRGGQTTDSNAIAILWSRCWVLQTASGISSLGLSATVYIWIYVCVC